MEKIFVKCEPECEDDLNDPLFTEEEIKVRGVKFNVLLTYTNYQSQEP